MFKITFTKYKTRALGNRFELLRDNLQEAWLKRVPLREEITVGKNNQQATGQDKNPLLCYLNMKDFLEEQDRANRGGGGDRRWGALEGERAKRSVG